MLPAFRERRAAAICSSNCQASKDPRFGGGFLLAGRRGPKAPRAPMRRPAAGLRRADGSVPRAPWRSAMLAQFSTGSGPSTMRRAEACRAPGAESNPEIVSVSSTTSTTSGSPSDALSIGQRAAPVTRRSARRARAASSRARIAAERATTSTRITPPCDSGPRRGSPRRPRSESRAPARSRPAC